MCIKLLPRIRKVIIFHLLIISCYFSYSQSEFISISAGVSKYSSIYKNDWGYDLSNSIYVGRCGNKKFTYNLSIGVGMYRSKIIPLNKNMNITLAQLSLGPQYNLKNDLLLRTSFLFGFLFNREYLIQRPYYYYNLDKFDYSLLIGVSKNIIKKSKSSISLELTFQRSLDSLLSSKYQTENIRINNISLGLIFKSIRKRNISKPISK